MSRTRLRILIIGALGLLAVGFVLWLCPFWKLWGSADRFRDEFKLAKAVVQGNLSEVQRLLNQGVSPEASNENRVPVLRLAASKGHAAIVEFLLQKGAKIDAGQFTALAAAASGRHDKVMKVLLEHGANPNATIPGKPDFPDGDTALTLAVERNCVECVKLLLNQGGIDIDRATPGSSCGGTALMRAVCQDRYDIAKLLLDKSADPNAIKGRDKESPLQRACKDGDTQMCRLLKSSGRKDSR
jgi:ankyrin repeat protein